MVLLNNCEKLFLKSQKLTRRCFAEGRLTKKACTILKVEQH